MTIDPPLSPQHISLLDYASSTEKRLRAHVCAASLALCRMEVMAVTGQKDEEESMTQQKVLSEEEVLRLILMPEMDGHVAETLL